MLQILQLLRENLKILLSQEIDYNKSADNFILGVECGTTSWILPCHYDVCGGTDIVTFNHSYIPWSYIFSIVCVTT